MSKTAAYGVSAVTFTPTGGSAISFQAIVKDSLQFNDQAGSQQEIEVEDMEGPYAILQTSAGTRGFTMDTYDMTGAVYSSLYAQIGKRPTGAVSITTKALDDIPAMTFAWTKMQVTVTRAGTLGKSGFPNFHLEFRELTTTNQQGQEQSGHTVTPVESNGGGGGGTGGNGG